jgi:hypothetical protein
MRRRAVKLRPEHASLLGPKYVLMRERSERERRPASSAIRHAEKARFGSDRRLTRRQGYLVSSAAPGLKSSRVLRPATSRWEDEVFVRLRRDRRVRLLDLVLQDSDIDVYVHSHLAALLAAHLAYPMTRQIRRGRSAAKRAFPIAMAVINATAIGRLVGSSQRSSSARPASISRPRRCQLSRFRSPLIQLCSQHRQHRLEPLWSPKGCNRWQPLAKRSALGTAKISGNRALDCDPLPIGAHGKEGSTVGVRQRAYVKCLQSALYCCLRVEHADTFRTHFWDARRTATSRDAFWRRVPKADKITSIDETPGKKRGIVVWADETTTSSQILKGVLGSNPRVASSRRATRAGSSTS